MNLDLLTADFPRDREAAARILAHFESTSKKRDAASKVYSINRMFDIANPSSKEALIKLLTKLVQQGLIDQFVRLELNATGIGDFPSIMDVPDEIFDHTTGENVRVNTENLRLYYKLHSG